MGIRVHFDPPSDANAEARTRLVHRWTGPLADDATTVLLEWRPDGPQRQYLS
ncbi:hypothetical protein NE236_15745 [Actinoallomurus purpureus]|uniref:hypothetical protein n=1 Tax=Actinoallomurus purpureus TaxID=478114 RepID=UPI0020929835|nr:hypothetical protein [Actinoallomurus purpureus]MCO6006438.1 hypothetical protein [Actinoallomurus purpureus]